MRVLGRREGGSCLDTRSFRDLRCRADDGRVRFASAEVRGMKMFSKFNWFFDHFYGIRLSEVKGRKEDRPEDD